LKGTSMLKAQGDGSWVWHNH